MAHVASCACLIAKMIECTRLQQVPRLRRSTSSFAMSASATMRSQGARGTSARKSEGGPAFSPDDAAVGRLPTTCRPWSVRVALRSIFRATARRPVS